MNGTDAAKQVTKNEHIETRNHAMSALKTIEVDISKFFKGTGSDVEKFAVAFEKLFKKAPSALDTVENFTEEAAPFITAAVSLADPVLEPEVAAALAIAERGLAAIAASATAANSGTSLLTNIQNFATTVPSLLTGVAVKNPALQSSITKVVNLVTGECKVLIPAVTSWIAQLAAKAAPAAPAATAGATA
jgi:hypothetical protein